MSKMLEIYRLFGVMIFDLCFQGMLDDEEKKVPREEDQKVADDMMNELEALMNPEKSSAAYVFL